MKKLYWILLLGTFAIDQITKYIIDATMQLGQSIPVIKNFFSITAVHNTGAAWSMFEGQMVLFAIVSIIALGIMIAYFASTKQEEFITRSGLILMISGTLGNFYDRMMFQYVRDFLDFNIFGYDFPVFNVADICLCVGAGLIILTFVIEQYWGLKR
ncbi:MAG: signal peptidase II [Longicatena sp.]|nr:signal peptidase II [Longicatena sp.]